MPFDVDSFIPQCAVVLTRPDETVRVPAYECLIREDEMGAASGFATGGGGGGGAALSPLNCINPLRRRNTDVLLSQRIKFLRTHSSNVIESTTAYEESALTLSGCLNGHKRLKTVADMFETESGSGGDTPQSFMPLSYLLEDADQINRLESYAPFWMLLLLTSNLLRFFLSKVFIHLCALYTLGFIFVIKL